MRNLTLKELDLVSGAVGPDDFKNYKPPVSAHVINAVTKVIPAARAFSAGYAVGNLINKHTPIQSWISAGIDKLTSDGNDYCNDGTNYGKDGGNY